MAHRHMCAATGAEGRDSCTSNAHLRSERRLAIAFPASARGMSKLCDLQAHDVTLSANPLSNSSTTAAASVVSTHLSHEQAAHNHAYCAQRCGCQIERHVA